MKCPRCKSASYVVEYNIVVGMVFEVIDGIPIDPEASGEGPADTPGGYRAKCNECEHTWRARHRQVRDMLAAHGIAH